MQSVGRRQGASGKPSSSAARARGFLRSCRVRDCASLTAVGVVVCRLACTTFSHAFASIPGAATGSKVGLGHGMQQAHQLNAGSLSHQEGATRKYADRQLLNRGTLHSQGQSSSSSQASSASLWGSARVTMRVAAIAFRLSGQASLTRHSRRLGRIGMRTTTQEECEQIKLYPQRWVQLALLALLAMISDLVCFSVAATPQTWKTTFGEDPAELLDIFLFTNVAFCFFEPMIVSNFGLRIPIVGAAFLMAIGCFIRSGIPLGGFETLPDYNMMIIGTMFVGMAQPFFQCTPPMLSATWFAPSERAMATAIAINFNQVGIAAAFLLGGQLAVTAPGIKQYFDIITFSAVLVGLTSLFAFQERPPSPPSASEMERGEAHGDSDVPFPEQAWKLLNTPGFLQPLIAFVASIMVTNVIGAFMERRLVAAGITDQQTINFAGAGFEFAIVLGGIVLGGVVDRNKEYKNVTLACLVTTLGAIVLYGLGASPPVVVLAALMTVGALAGPVQPINAELAVEATYPSDENAIEAIQQLCGNLASALLVPVCAWAAGYQWSLPFVPAASLEGDAVLLAILVLGATGYFSTFSARLLRTETDEQCLIPEQALQIADEELVSKATQQREQQQQEQQKESQKKPETLDVESTARK